MCLQGIDSSSFNMDTGMCLQGIDSFSCNMDIMEHTYKGLIHSHVTWTLECAYMGLIHHHVTWTSRIVPIRD